jgi:hypothetical protein
MFQSSYGAQPMTKPRLIFFCELETAPMQALFSIPDMVALSDLGASVSLGILDLSPERAEIVRRLNQAGIPVIAWLLLPHNEGYWFNLQNATQASARYAAFREWTRKYDLQWEAVGLDIEPDIRDMERVAANRWEFIPVLVRRLFSRERTSKSVRIYKNLVEQIRADGYLVDTYQFPFIVDERIARSCLLQRAAGLVDIKADREVLLLYSSFMRPHGPGVLWSYGPSAQSIGVGSLGGGIDLSSGEHRPLTWEEFERDLRLAWVFTDYIHIFSLEGCVRQGFLTRLKDFKWDMPIIDPDVQAVWVDSVRHSLHTLLWLGSRPHIVAGFILAAMLVVARLRRGQ